jgi:hypothetical protein
VSTPTHDTLVRRTVRFMGKYGKDALVTGYGWYLIHTQVTISDPLLFRWEVLALGMLLANVPGAHELWRARIGGPSTGPSSSQSQQAQQPTASPGPSSTTGAS